MSNSTIKNKLDYINACKQYNGMRNIIDNDTFSLQKGSSDYNHRAFCGGRNCSGLLAVSTKCKTQKLITQTKKDSRRINTS